MQLPFFFSLGPVQIEAHLIFEALAYFMGFQYYRHLRFRNRDVICDDSRLWVIIGGVIGAAVFSKLLGCLEHPELFLRAQENIVYLLTSKTIVGGLIGGVFGVELTKKFLGISRSTGDLFCFPIILGMMIGRLGCFLAGARDGTWGNETHWITGIDGGDGVLRHPFPLYEIGVLALIWVCLHQLKNRFPLREGDLFKIFLWSYLLWRFCAEFLKPVIVINPLGISAIQVACLLGVLYYSTQILKFKHI